jgi:transcriptional regulator with XRE-family HTH domain
MNAMTEKEKMFFRKLGSRIRKLRKEQSITQLELADMLGTNQPVVAKWEKGTRKMPANILPPIAKALNTSYEKLLDGTD